MQQQRQRWLAQTLPASAQVLAGLGRHSLSYYLLHQPVLIALAGGLSLLLK
ncbi:heparan-alpha-glucosaminide N-acetyltransferase domain-containing protein [Rhodoferax sp.]|uniref:heparan-alpha-glucosaminide N-acetyltransferase domain-containing protein n=1 Tax=Rhodoferax sp. TaxID=50421 RepID=UPI0025CD6A5D|nr:heparan-alpha-glucosaminide N-acetyltransferase domain-containing protein [Rhodoferax sp.]